MYFVILDHIQAIRTPTSSFFILDFVIFMQHVQRFEPCTHHWGIWHSGYAFIFVIVIDTGSIYNTLLNSEPLALGTMSSTVLVLLSVQVTSLEIT